MWPETETDAQRRRHRLPALEQDRTRQRLLSALGIIAYARGDHLVAASDEAAELAMQLGGETERFQFLDERTYGCPDQMDCSGAARAAFG